MEAVLVPGVVLVQEDSPSDPGLASIVFEVADEHFLTLMILAKEFLIEERPAVWNVGSRYVVSFVCLTLDGLSKSIYFLLQFLKLLSMNNFKLFELHLKRNKFFFYSISFFFSFLSNPLLLFEFCLNLKHLFFQLVYSAICLQDFSFELFYLGLFFFDYDPELLLLNF